MKNLVAFGARKEESSESSDSDVDTDEEEYHMLLNKWLNLKNENLRLQHDLVQSRSTSKSGAKEACQEVRRDVRQEARQEVPKHGCAAGTRKETDRCISNCIMPSKKQHQM
ncbi:hypothetical protein F2Q69_00047104 [Brassica cretica]|nr:hypothetical protein DY000_02059662 [Brassica cretica]KAF3521652.1 hypothetical protein F2Q69_00047104 [Brassica cretica]